MGDIRDMSAVHQVLQDAQPEIVIHMAAQSLVRYLYQNPVETYAANVPGAVHLIEAARKSKGIKAVVNITIDKCYENREWVRGIVKANLWADYDPHSNSKGCAELVSSGYRLSYFLIEPNMPSMVSLWQRLGRVMLSVAGLDV